MQVIVLGAGWAGLSAAINLIQRGITPIIIEASPQAGGRAREIIWNNMKIDNGQHLLIGAYTDFLELINIIHSDKINYNKSFDRVPFELNYFHDNNNNMINIIRKNKFYFKTKGINFNDKISLLKFLYKLILLKKNDDISVQDFLTKNKLTKKIEAIIKSICVSALSTAPENSSMKIFKNVITDTFFTNKKYSDLIIPNKSLSELFVKPACNYIIKNGGKIFYNTRVLKINRNSLNNKITNINTNKGDFFAENYISALPYSVFNKLFENIQHNLLPEKITTIYIKFKKQIALPYRITGLLNKNIDFIFDKSCEYPGLISVVSSSNNEFNNFSKNKMFEVATKEIEEIYPEIGQIEDSKIITEKFAAYTCNNINNNLNNKKSFENLFIAGDFSYSKYPATLESALRSGKKASYF